MTQAQALILSLIVEAPLVAAGAGVAPRRFAAAAGCAGTLLTHPVAWSAARALSPMAGWAVSAAVVEGAVVLAEAAALRWALGLAPGRAVAVSAAANAASFTVGLLIAATRTP